MKHANTPSTVISATLRLAALMMLAAAAWTPSARAADGNPPDRLTYQGFLVDASGATLAQTAPKNYDVIFRIYNHETASGANYRLWTELQTVTVDKGYFSVVLGEGGAYGTELRPSLSSVFTNQTDASDRFIEMSVRGIGSGGADSTILPRLRLMTSPYAMLARTAVDARTLANPSGGQIVSVTGTNVGINKTSPGSALDVNGTLTATRINATGGGTLGGAVTASDFSANTLSSTVINGGTVTASGSFNGPGTIPLGGIIMWSGSTPPSGWAVCNGQSVNGYTTPDLQGRFILGAGSGAGLTSRVVKQTGGSETHTLTLSEMPNHTHSVNDPGHSHSINDPGHGHGYSYGTDGWDAQSRGYFQLTDRYGGYRTMLTSQTGISINSSRTGIQMGATGDGRAHDIMPPYYVLAFIMRVQ